MGLTNPARERVHLEGMALENKREAAELCWEWTIAMSPAVKGWCYLPYLPALSLELGTQGSRTAQLLFQLARAFSMARIPLLQLPHLPPELLQLTQAAPAAVQSGLQLPCTFGGLSERGIGSGNFRRQLGYWAGKGFSPRDSGSR